MRVLLWDRPGCGGSDISFAGPSESDVNAEALIGLVRHLGIERIAVTGGSAGARISLIAAARAPELVSHLAVWWVSGGAISLASLAAYYYGEAGDAVVKGGMEAVTKISSWAEQIARNPKNREIILAQDPDEFLERMQKWAAAFAWSDSSPVPGMTREDFAKLTMPVMIYKSAKSDLYHTKRTAEWVHELIPHSRLINPPWAEDEWNNASATKDQPGRGLFESWPLLAPELIAFVKG
jgi:2-hydroxy-6-oxonona-2,4-dienedioate hydrolase